MNNKHNNDPDCPLGRGDDTHDAIAHIKHQLTEAASIFALIDTLRYHDTATKHNTQQDTPFVLVNVSYQGTDARPFCTLSVRGQQDHVTV